MFTEFNQGTDKLKDIKEAVSKELLLCGFSAHWSGYMYLREAVIAVILNEKYLFGITKNLYPYIAKIYGTSSYAVERAIRKAITRVCKDGVAEKYKGSNDENHFTNKEFIAAVANEVRNNCEYGIIYQNGTIISL